MINDGINDGPTAGINSYKIMIVLSDIMFTICGQHVILKVKSVQLLQMGNVLYCYPLNFVVLPTESQTHKTE